MSTFPKHDQLAHTVSVCPYCGEETHERVYWGDSLTTCRDHGIIESQAIAVPVAVFEAGHDAVRRFIEAQRAEGSAA